MKNLKKILAIVVVVAIVASLTAVFVGCSEEEKTNSITIGLITLHDSSSTYDKNFIDAMDVAKKNLEDAGYSVKVIIKSGIGENEDCYTAAADLVEQGCDMIMADSFGHEDYIIKAAKEFPNVTFCHATGTKAHTVNLANYHNAFASIYEGRYLAGVAAGLKLLAMYDTDNDGAITDAEATVGYVGAYTYAEVISGYTAWYLGVKSVVSNVSMKVQFTGSWYNVTAEKEAANTLIQDGCKLISQHADSMGAPTACKEANIPNVTYNVATESDCAGSYIIASRINWAPYYEYVAKAILKGETIATDWVGTISTGSVEILEIGSAAAAGTSDKLEAVKAQLIKGELKVFDTNNFTVKGAKVTTYMADVDTDTANTPDQEACVNGEIKESSFRSAPYFALQIDGITLLNSIY